VSQTALLLFLGEQVKILSVHLKHWRYWGSPNDRYQQIKLVHSKSYLFGGSLGSVSDSSITISGRTSKDPFRTRKTLAILGEPE
jgi:hypothetical protein